MAQNDHLAAKFGFDDVEPHLVAGAPERLE
jgi:hypothetical protein